MDKSDNQFSKFQYEPLTVKNLAAAIKASRDRETGNPFGTPTPISEEARRLLGSERVRYEVPLHKLRGRYIDKRKLRRFKRNRARWLASIKTHCPKQTAPEPDDGEKDT